MKPVKQLDATAALYCKNRIASDNPPILKLRRELSQMGYRKSNGEPVGRGAFVSFLLEHGIQKPKAKKREPRYYLVEKVMEGLDRDFFNMSHAQLDARANAIIFEHRSNTSKYTSAELLAKLKEIASYMAPRKALN